MSKRQFLGEFEIYVLGARMRLGRDAYGMAICREIEQRTGREVAIGAIYATLARLEAKGLVATGWSKPDPIPGGRARRLVQLTPEGRRALAHSAGMLARIVPAHVWRRS